MKIFEKIAELRVFDKRNSSFLTNSQNPRLPLNLAFGARGLWPLCPHRYTSGSKVPAPVQPVKRGQS